MNLWWMLTDEEAERLNPPLQGITGDEEGRVYIEHINDRDWQPVGYIPSPRTRLGWFVYHLIHGLAMRYPWWKVFGYAFANNKPGEDIDLRELAEEYENYILWSDVEGHEYELMSFNEFMAWAESGRSKSID